MREKSVFLGKNIHSLSFGGAAISGEGGGYGFGHISENDSLELLEYAFDKGIRVFDSAPIYGFGLSEERIGKGLKSVREECIFISKSGVDWHDTKRVNMSNDPKITEKMILESLKRFNTEYIDLYMIHWPDARVDIRRPMEVLAKYKEKGVLRHLGLCNTNIEELAKASEIAEVEVVQSEYNLFNRSVENEIFDYIQDKKINFMSWGTLDKGLLTGSYNLKRNFDDADCRKKAPWWKKSDVEKKHALVEEAKKYLKETDYTFLDLAIGFNLKNKNLTTVLSGPKSKERLDQLLSSIDKSQEVIDGFKYWRELEDHLQKFYE